MHAIWKSTNVAIDHYSRQFSTKTSIILVTISAFYYCFFILWKGYQKLINHWTIFNHFFGPRNDIHFVGKYYYFFIPCKGSLFCWKLDPHVIYEPISWLKRISGLREPIFQEKYTEVEKASIIWRKFKYHKCIFCLRTGLYLISCRCC